VPGDFGERRIGRRPAGGRQGSRSRGCTIALCIATTLLIVIGAPAGASAARWEVAGKILKSPSETELLEGEGVLTIGVKGLSTTLKCGAGMNDLAIGGATGTDEVQTFGISCTDSSSCTVEKMVATKLGYKSELKESGTPPKYYDLIKEMEITFTISGASCPTAGKYILEANLEGVVENSTHMLVFPSTPLSGTKVILNSLTAMKSYFATVEGELEFATQHHVWEWKVVT
jgi:hypothetical protein